MRRLASTLILLVVLAGLGGYIWYIDRQPPVDANAKDKTFANVKPEDIEEVQIALAGGDDSTLQKTGDNWQLVTPVKADADQSAVSAITSGITTLDIQRVVDENAANLAQYGLQPARIDVRFKAKGDKEPRRVLLGEKTPTGNEIYAVIPSNAKKVFLVNSYVDSTFNKNTFALRDKGILKFDREKADTLELADGASVLQFQRKGTDWSVVKPIAVRGDYGAIEAIAERLSSAQMQGVVEAEAGDLKKYGLDKPVSTITAVSGSSRATLLLGKTENALVYGKDAARPMVFTVAPTIRTDIFKDVSEYRRKDLFDARSFTTNKVEIHRGSETFVFTKSKDKDSKDVWKRDGKDVDAMKMDDLLAKITGLRAMSFEAGTHASLASPVLMVTTTFDDTKTDVVTLGRAGADVFGKRADEPGTAKLEAGPLDEALKALDAVK